VAKTFTVTQARALLPDLLERAAEFVALRADITEVSTALSSGARSPLGGVPELKGWEARAHELVGWFTGQGLQVKGLAPLLLDFPADLDGVEVLLCWLEGDPELAWYHRLDLGFAGRRPLP
jgi:hypothetical protein